MPVIKLKALDSEFEHFLDSVKVEHTKTELTPALRKQRRALADKDDLKFCEIYFPDICHQPFNRLHKHVAQLDEGNHTLSGARLIGKSAFTYLAKGLKRLALGGPGIVNITLRTQEQARERTAALVRIMKRNKKLMYDYSINIQQDLKGHYIINNTHLVATSVRMGLRGILSDDFQRFVVSINDDLYNRDSVNSEEDNQKVADFIMSEIYGQMEDGGLCITMGNQITETCPINKIKEEYPNNHYSMPALDEKDKTTWSESKIHTTEYWLNKRKNIPFDVWNGEYMDSPLRKGDVFDIDWLRTIKVDTTKIITSISAIDPSYGTSPSACEKGIATLGITNDNKIICQDIYLRKEDYSNVFDYVEQLRVSIPYWKILLFENDFNQWAIAKPYYEIWTNKRKKYLPITNYSSKELRSEYYGTNKEGRIMNLVHPHQTGSFYYGDEVVRTSDYKKYRAQYLSFGKAKGKLDGLDAMATAFIMLKSYIEQGNFKPLNHRKFIRKLMFR
jgi:hypothetical protein